MATKENDFLQYQADIDKYYSSLDSIDHLKQEIQETQVQFKELTDSEKELKEKVSQAERSAENANKILLIAQQNLKKATNSKDTNLLDDAIYKTEFSKIDKEQFDKIKSETERIEKEAEEKRQGTLDRLRELKSKRKNDKFVIPSSLTEKVTSIKHKRTSWDEFFDKNDNSDRVKKIKETILGASDSEIQRLSKNFVSTTQLINKCNSVDEVENGGEPDYSENELNTTVIPFGFAGVAAVFFILLFLQFDYAWTDTFADSIASIFLHGVIIAFLGLLSSLLANKEIGLRIGMVIAIPSTMLIILILNSQGQNVGFFSWVGSIFLLILLGAALFGLCFILSEGAMIPMGVVGAVLSLIWLLKIELRTPEFLINSFSLLTGGLIRFGVPILLSVGIFFFVAFLFTQTDIGKLTVIFERKRMIAILIENVEKSIDDFTILYNYKEIGKYVQNAEDIASCNALLSLLDKETKSSIEKSKTAILADCRKRKEELAEERKIQQNEKDSIITKCWNSVTRSKEEKNNADIAFVRAKTELDSYETRLEATKTLLNEKKSELKAKETSIVNLKEKIKKTANSLSRICKDPLDQTAGKLCDSLFLNLPVENSEGFQVFKQIQHNSEKLVLIYNENEIENNNLSRSLSNYIDWFVKAFVNVNRWEVIDNIHFKILDVVSGASNYIGGNNGQIFEAFGDPRAITQYERKIRDHINRITELSDLYELKEVNIEELNNRILETAKNEGEEFGTEARNEQYIITFVLIPIIGVNNVEIIPASLWTSFNDCKRYGIMPIFLVGGNTWDSMDDNSQLKVQVKKKNVYYISGGKFKKMKISSTEY